MNYVYVLRSFSDGKFYIGHTTDLKERFKEHQKGFVSSTQFRRPFELLYYEAHHSLTDAKRRELYFKTAKGKATLKLMLRVALQERRQDSPFLKTPSQV